MWLGTTLNIDEFRVTVLCPSLAVTMDPFFSSTTRGTGLNGVLSLLVFGCLTRTVSPNLILLSLAPSFWSAYAFIFFFCSASLSARFCVSGTICWRAGAGDANSGRVVLSFLWFSASHDEIPVVECGVVRYYRKTLLSSCFQFLCSTVAALMHFSSVVMKRSASHLPLAKEV